MKRRVPRILPGLLLLALTAGCGTAATVGAGGGARQQSAAPSTIPVDAGLVTARFGWVLTTEQLLLTADGGISFHPAGLNLPPGPARAAFFLDAAHGWAAATGGGSITLARTSDAGRTWQIDTIQGSPPIGGLRLAFGDAEHGMLLAREATSPAFSRATIYATGNGGASWSGHAAPGAGEIAMEPGGRTWLAGGTATSQLYLSTDQGQSWSRSQLRFAAPVQSATVSPPVQGTLPVTVNRGGHSLVALLTTGDGGRTWTEKHSIPLQADLGTGTQAAIGATRSGVVVVDPAATAVYRTAGPAAATVSQSKPSGLPAGVARVAFAPGSDNTGWALTASGKCARFKQDCSITHELLATDNGGVNWHPLLRWEEPI